MSKPTITDVCNMINNYNGSQGERDAIIRAIRPAARYVANKHLNRPLLSLFHALDDLEMLIYLHVLKMLQKRKKIPCNCALNKVLYCGLIDELRAEERRIRRDPKSAEYQLGLLDEGGEYGVVYLYTDKIDFLADFETITLETTHKGKSDYYKELFCRVVFDNVGAAELAKQLHIRPETVSAALSSVTKTLCKLYGSDYRTVRHIIANYNQTQKAPKERCRYGQLMDCKMLSVPAYYNTDQQ